MSNESEDLKAMKNQLGSLIAEMEELNACFKAAAEGIAKTNLRTAQSTQNISMWCWIIGILLILDLMVGIGLLRIR